MQTTFILLRYLFWLATASASLVAVWGLAVVLYFWPSLTDEVEQLKDLDQLLADKLEVPLRIYTADEKLIAEFGEHRRTTINYADIPQNYINALLAAEDADFYTHLGIDIKGLLRAAVQLADTGRIQSGGSTITMQVARNYLLTSDRTFARKIREILLSLRIEQLLSKQDILELYVNKIYLGNKAYGIRAAAEVYYGKELEELNLAQLAMLAGLPKAPSAYNPLANPRRALIRRNWILSRMHGLNLLDDLSYETALRAPITAKFHPAETEVYAPYVAESARKFALDNFGNSIYTQGLKIYTSINSEQQLAANKAINSGLLGYDRRRGWRGAEQTGIAASSEQEELTKEALDEIKASSTNLEQIDEVLVDPRNKRLTQQLGHDVSNWLKTLDSTPSYGGLQAAIVVEAKPEELTLLIKQGELITINSATWQWAGRFHSVFWKDPQALAGNRLVKVGDLIRLAPLADSELLAANQGVPWQLAQLPRLEASLVAMDTNNGQITALVGGFDFNLSRFNRAEQAERQAGSVLKPFIYMAALEKGYTPATIINDAPVVFEDQQLEDVWRPQNSTGTFYGPTRLREGLYKSRNLISIRVLNYVGLRPAINYLAKFGLDSRRLPRDLSLALGSANLTPVEITSAYAMIANGGYKIEPHLVTSIENNDGDILYKANLPQICVACNSKQDKPEDLIEAEQLVDPKAVYTMHSILRDVIDDGTGARAKTLNRKDIRGKTGTTNDLQDTWFTGFNTDIVASVWAGFDQPETTGEYGANLALPMWIEFMQTALANKPEKLMPRPNGLTTVRIDPKNGLLAASGQKNAIFEIFYTERVPKQTSQTGASSTNVNPSNPLEELPPEALF